MLSSLQRIHVSFSWHLLSEMHKIVINLQHPSFLALQAPRPSVPRYRACNHEQPTTLAKHTPYVARSTDPIPYMQVRTEPKKTNDTGAYGSRGVRQPTRGPVSCGLRKATTKERPEWGRHGTIKSREEIAAVFLWLDICIDKDMNNCICGKSIDSKLEGQTLRPCGSCKADNFEGHIKGGIDIQKNNLKFPDVGSLYHLG